jgi:penicillin-binding protein 1B
VLAAEDRNFFVHPGIDPLAVSRAIVANLRAGAPRQGGSTITQQLVKNTFLSPRRTLGRKAQEAVLALLLEARATKEDILQRYLASVYLGVEGGVPVHGFGQAAEVYFGRALGELGAAECALLAGIIRSPNGLSPRRRPQAARARRNRVLALMVRQGLLGAAEGTRARALPLGLSAPRTRAVAALYVAAEVSRSLERLLPVEVARAPGLSVFTGIDADMQRDAERVVRRRLGLLGKAPAGGLLQAALVAIDPSTGHVRALVGGRDFGSSPLDRAVRARRQPGSAFKPFVYLAALDPARRPPGRSWTAVSHLDDVPLAVGSGRHTWRPANYDGTFAGTLPLEDAFADSRNVATVRLALDVGIDAVARSARDLGVRSPLPSVPALALGAAETSLIELTAAYGVFASGGVLRPATLVLAVTSAASQVVYAAPPDERRVLAPEVAYLMTHLLARVVDAGTGQPARASGLTGAAAGKTGTTDETRDSWFIGFTPALVAGVWVGCDDGRPTGFTGARAALPVWTDFIRAATSPGGAADFVVPPGIVWRHVDPASGDLAGAACPESRAVPFIAGTEPQAPCAMHRSVGVALRQQVEGAGRTLGQGRRRLGTWLGRLFRR